MNPQSSSILHIEQTNDYTLIQVLPRRIYMEITDAFREEMIAILDSASNRFIIDLSPVSIMNSTAIGVLLLARDRMLKRQGKLVICGLQSLLREVFYRMQLEAFFAVTETVGEAKKLVEQE